MARLQFKRLASCAEGKIRPTSFVLFCLQLVQPIAASKSATMRFCRLASVCVAVILSGVAIPCLALADSSVTTSETFDLSINSGGPVAVTQLLNFPAIVAPTGESIQSLTVDVNFDQTASEIVDEGPGAVDTFSQTTSINTSLYGGGQLTYPSPEISSICYGVGAGIGCSGVGSLFNQPISDAEPFSTSPLGITRILPGGGISVTLQSFATTSGASDASVFAGTAIGSVSVVSNFTQITTAPSPQFTSLLNTFESEIEPISEELNGAGSNLIVVGSAATAIAYSLQSVPQAAPVVTALLALQPETVVLGGRLQDIFPAPDPPPSLPTIIPGGFVTPALAGDFQKLIAGGFQQDVYAGNVEDDEDKIEAALADDNLSIAASSEAQFFDDLGLLSTSAQQQRLLYLQLAVDLDAAGVPNFPITQADYLEYLNDIELNGQNPEELSILGDEGLTPSEIAGVPSIEADIDVNDAPNSLYGLVDAAALGNANLFAIANTNTSVPEPSSLPIFLAGFVALATVRCRTRKTDRNTSVEDLDVI